MKKQFASQLPSADMSFESIDLASNIQLHKCSNCSTPLNQFTKIIAEMDSTKQSSTWEMYCVPCFTRWSPENFDNKSASQTLSRKYIICKRTDKQLVKFNWSIDELYWLIHMLKSEFFYSRSGVFNVLKIQRQLEKRTGNKRKKEEIQQIIQEFVGSDFSKKKNLDYFNQESIEANDLMSKLKQEVGQEKDVKKFMKAINYGHPISYSRNYPDNHAQFMSKVMATSSQLQKKLDTRPDSSSTRQYQQKNKMLQILRDELVEKTKVDCEIQNFLGEICTKYVHINARERIVHQQDEKKIQNELLNFTHPQLSNLKKIAKVKTEWPNIKQIKKERQFFMEGLNQLKKSKSSSIPNTRSKVIRQGKLKDEVEEPQDLNEKREEFQDN